MSSDTAEEAIVKQALRPGEVAARLDRLPLRAVHWHLALATAAAWGLIIMDDGVMGKLYPFVWEDHFSRAVYSWLNAIQIGLGILVGEYLAGYLSDRYGRRWVMIASGMVSGFFMLLLAFTNNPAYLGVILFLQALGMGGILATHGVYLHEIAPPRMRGRLSMGAQSLTRLTTFGAIWPFFFWVPGGSPTDYRYAIYILAAGPAVILMPILFSIPESPRWLESKGRMAEAQRVLEKIEYRASKKGTEALPPPDFDRYEVVTMKKVPVSEIFRGEYARRSILLLICWMLGYAGIVYGLGAFRTLVLKNYGFSSHFIFAAGGITAVVGGGLGFLINSWTNERIDRRTAIGASAFVFAVGTALLYFYSGYHTKSVSMTVVSMLLTSFGSGVFLFQMYNYTSAAYPTRLRSVGTGWTDGFGHMGALVGSPVVVALYNATAASGFIGAYLFVIIVGAIIPGALMWTLGVRQKEAILEEVSQ